MSDHEITRRQFVRDGSLAAVALAAGLQATQTVRAGEATDEQAKKIRSYNPKMEYRRCGRTNFMVSAVALGGHWKRIDKVIGAERKGGWINNDQECGSDQNRRDVVTRCLQRGIKPFASNSIFKGDSSLESPTFEEDNRIARLALRHILCNPAITAPIPGLITPQQVDNCALAVLERRELDVEERARRDIVRHAVASSHPPTDAGSVVRLTGPRLGDDAVALNTP